MAATPEDLLATIEDLAPDEFAEVPGRQRSSVSNVPPVVVTGTPPSEIVIKDRR